MALNAIRDQQERTVNVNRESLIQTLETNLEKHIADYKAAVAGYKELALTKLDAGAEKAKKSIEKHYKRMKERIEEFEPGSAGEFSDYLSLVEPVSVQLKVPRSYEGEYRAAIDMAKWDVRETLELTHAEFQCFVRDEWDWKSDFEVTNRPYSMAMDCR